jgi:hypothetical protein
MGERIPFHLGGALSAYEGSDHAIGVLGVAGTIVRSFMTLESAPSGAAFACDVRDATAGGGDGLTVTIPDGEFYATNDSDQLALSDSEVLYLRVTAASSAIGLSGWLEFVPGAGAVGTFFTTLSRVQTDGKITGNDVHVSRLIQGVTKAMQSYMQRDIVDSTYTDEVHDGTGWTDAIILKHYPLTSTVTPVVKIDDSTIDSGLYTYETGGRIIYRKGADWTQGRRNIKVTYSAGFVGVPEDLAMAATAQVLHEFNQSPVSGKGKLGLESSADGAGGSTSYVPYDFLPFVLRVMNQYRRDF